MPTETRYVPIAFRFPRSLLKRIDRRAARLSLSRASVVRLLVTRGLDAADREEARHGKAQA